jgi:K+ transporter
VLARPAGQDEEQIAQPIDVLQWPLADRLEVHRLDKGFIRVIARYGFMDQPVVPELLGDAIRQFDLPCVLDDAT